MKNRFFKMVPKEPTTVRFVAALAIDEHVNAILSDDIIADEPTTVPILKMLSEVRMRCGFMPADRSDGFHKVLPRQRICLRGPHGGAPGPPATRPARNAPLCH